MKTNSKIFTAATLVAVSFLGAAMNAQADAPTQTVKYADLNLNTQAGAARLYARIRNAANQVCGVEDSRELERVAHAQACVAQAVMASVKAVNSPKLSMEYNSHGGLLQQPISLATAK